MNAKGVVLGGMSKNQANSPPNCAQSVPYNLHGDMD